MFLEVAGRAASSADNAQATSFFMTNDEGVWLIERPRGPDGGRAVQGDPAALGGPHGGRLAVVRQRGQAQGLRRALRVPREAVAVLPGLERPDHQRAGHDAVPARGGQHAPVHQRAADPAERAARQGAAVHRRLAAVPAVERDGVGGAGRRRSSGSSTRSRTSRSAASSAPAAASRRSDVPAPLGSITTVRTDYEAHFLFQNLMLTGRGAAARRVGARRADDPARLAARPGQGRPRPRLPRVQRARRSTRAGSAGRRCPPRSPTTSASTACSRACARRTSTTWTRPSTRCSRRSSGPTARTPTPTSSRRPTRTRRRRETYMKAAGHPPARGDRVHEGDLPLPGGDLRALPGAHGRVPPARHLGAVLAPGDRVLRAVRATRATSQRQAEGREIWDR